MNKSRRTGCKFLEAADRKTADPILGIANWGDCSTAEIQAVAGAITWSRRPVLSVRTNTAEITGSAFPAPGSRKMRPLD